MSRRFAPPRPVDSVFLLLPDVDGAGTKGEPTAIAVVKTGAAELEFELASPERFSRLELLLLDDTRDLEPVFRTGTIHGPLAATTPSDSGVFLLQCTRASSRAPSGRKH